MATVNLSTLAYTIPATQGNNYPREFLVYNTSQGSLNNGGQCCAWTVPNNASWVTFEIWGGGGGGAGSCCCQSGPGAGAGAYAVQTVNLTTYAGCTYTICAASSTCISPGTGGYGGNTTWVQGPGLSNFCATGGSYGCTRVLCSKTAISVILCTAHTVYRHSMALLTVLLVTAVATLTYKTAISLDNNLVL